MIKRIVNYLYDIIFDRRVLIFTSIIGIYILLNSPINKFLNITIVDPILSSIDTSLSSDLIAATILGGLLIFTFKKFKSYTPSIDFLTILLSVTLIYIRLRWSSIPWHFTASRTFSKIKYADILIFATGLNILLFYSREKKESNNLNIFLTDEAIANPNLDLLGFDNYSNEIAKKILNSNFNCSFAIGINGAWGFGKTSFLNLLKGHLRTGDNEIIEVEFNSWSSASPDAIVMDFFSALREEIQPFHSSIAGMLKKYSKKLVDLNKGSLTQSVNAVIDIFSSSDSTAHIYKEINEALRKIDRKIIVYIDDLDRSNKDEIYQIMRLIRNTANFYKIFFIVSYDRNYIIHALNKNQIFNSEQFLEKIFQLEITLPYYDKSVLRINLAEKLKKGISEKYHSEIDDVLLDKTKGVIPLGNWISSIRDVTRLANAFCLNIGKLLYEVDVRDFLNLEILRFKYPAVYYLLFSKTAFIFTTKNVQNNDLIYVLAKTTDPKTGNPTSEYKLAEYLDENFEDLSVQKTEIKNIVQFVAAIFSDYNIMPIGKSKLSIVYPRKFNRYFAYTLLKDNLSEVAFSNARILDQNSFNKTIANWCDKDLQSEIAIRFVQVDKFNDKEDFEKIIRAQFYFGNLIFLGEGYPLGYDLKNLEQKMNDDGGRISRVLVRCKWGHRGVLEVCQIPF